MKSMRRRVTARQKAAARLRSRLVTKDLRAAAVWREAHDPAASPADWRDQAFLSLLNVGSGKRWAERIVERWQADVAGDVADRLAALRQAMADAASQHDVTQCQSGFRTGTRSRKDD